MTPTQQRLYEVFNFDRIRPQTLTWAIRQIEDRKPLDLRKPELSLKIFGNSG